MAIPKQRYEILNLDVGKHDGMGNERLYDGSRYPFKRLKVGQGFWLQPHVMRNRVQMCASRLRKESGNTLKFKIFDYVEGSACVRIA